MALELAMTALEPGHTVELRPGEWYGRDALTLTIQTVKRNSAGIWLSGADEHGNKWTTVLVHHYAEGNIETRWLAAGNLKLVE